MTVWDFSTEEAWEAMENRAAWDAQTAVDDYWPWQQREPSPGMPQDLDFWARQLTFRFLGDTFGLPLWALQHADAQEGTYKTVRNAYYRRCYAMLKWCVTQRVNQYGMLPRQTEPPAIAAPNHRPHKTTVPRPNAANE